MGSNICLEMNNNYLLTKSEVFTGEFDLHNSRQGLLLN